jgi:hypothetical protein
MHGLHATCVALRMWEGEAMHGCVRWGMLSTSAVRRVIDDLTFWVRLMIRGSLRQ